MSALALLALVGTATSGSWCDSCAPSRGLDAGPVMLGFLDGGLGAPRAAVPRSELGLVVGGSLLAAFDDFYGHLRGRAIASASWAIDGRLEVSAQVELVRVETVIASVQASRLGFGATSLGATWWLAGGASWDFAIGTRLVLPTDLGARRDALPFGADAAALVSKRFAEGLEAHGHAILLGTVQISEGPSFPRVGLSVGGGVSWQALSWLSLTGDAAALLGYDDPLDRLVAALVARFRLTPSWAIELSAAAPLAGEDRTLFVAGLGARLSLP